MKTNDEIQEMMVRARTNVQTYFNEMDNELKSGKTDREVRALSSQLFMWLGWYMALANIQGYSADAIIQALNTEVFDDLCDISNIFPVEMKL